MTKAMKSLASIVKSSLRAGLKVSFTEEELKVMGIKVPKSKQQNFDKNWRKIQKTYKSY